MKRRTLIQAIVSAAAWLPLRPLRLFAQPRELTRDAISTLHEIAPTLLPSSLGALRTRQVVDRFVAWTRGYEEGVALAHGYGHPRLQKSGPSPVPRYVAQLSALESEARRDGGGWRSLNVERRRAILDAAFTSAGVRTLPSRPLGQHVAADLMAFYFRSSDANDDCYTANIGRETCRPIALTLRRPEPRS